MICSGLTRSSSEPVMAMSSHRKVLKCLTAMLTYSTLSIAIEKPTTRKYKMVPTNIEVMARFFFATKRLRLKIQLSNMMMMKVTTQAMNKKANWMIQTITSHEFMPLLENSPK